MDYLRLVSRQRRWRSRRRRISIMGQPYHRMVKCYASDGDGDLGGDRKKSKSSEDGGGVDDGGDGSGGGGDCVLAATSMPRFLNEKRNESQACGKWCPKRFIFCKNIFVICSCFTMHEKALTDGALNRLHRKRERETPKRPKRMNENANRTSEQKNVLCANFRAKK